MSPVTWIVVGFVTLLVVLAIAATVALVVQRTRRLVASVEGIAESVQPELERLRENADVARTELERVADARAELGSGRDA